MAPSFWRDGDDAGNDAQSRDHSSLVVGRLKEGVSIGQAQSDLDAIAGRLEQQYPNTNTGRAWEFYRSSKTPCANIKRRC